MFDKIEQLDQELLVKINSWHSPFFDEWMWQISHQWMWMPLYVFFIYVIFKKFKLASAVMILVGVGLCFLLADRISVMVFKEVILRYRPTHHLEIGPHLHLYEKSNGEFYRGGQYGFVSSHAANFFALSTYLFLLLKKQSKWWGLLFIWAILIGYSRMYLGVHYPLDVIGGALLGIFIGWLVFKLLTKFAKITYR